MSIITTQLLLVGLARNKPQGGRFALNLGSNLANFGLSILVGIWFTPYLIRHLGVAAYGLVPLAVTVTSYMGLFTTALNAAVGRFITLSLDRNDHVEANRFFNTSFWGTVAVLAVLLGPALWLSSQARFFFNVPAGYENQFAWLLLCTIGMFFLTTLASPFGVATFCRNRFDLSNAIAIVTTLVPGCRHSAPVHSVCSKSMAHRRGDAGFDRGRNRALRGRMAASDPHVDPADLRLQPTRFAALDRHGGVDGDQPDRQPPLHERGSRGDK